MHFPFMSYLSYFMDATVSLEGNTVYIKVFFSKKLDHNRVGPNIRTILWVDVK